MIAIEFSLYFLYQMTWELFSDRRICRIMQILSCGAFCLFAFSTFIYQDMWSLAFQTGAMYLQLLYMKRRRIRYEVGAGICLAIAVQLKNNCPIALIAMMLLLVVDALWRAVPDSDGRGKEHSAEKPAFAADAGEQPDLAAEMETGGQVVGERRTAGADRQPDPETASAGTNDRKKSAGQNADTRKQGGWRGILVSLALALMLAVMTFGLSAAVDTYTVYRTGIEEMPEGMPAIAYFAMGMQTTEGKSGWYNGFTVGIYADSGHDIELTKQLALEGIEESIAEFQNSGRYFVNFYYQKFISQWGDSTCVSMRELENTSRHQGDLSWLQNTILFGTGGQIMQWIMNVYHSLIYLGMLLYLGWLIFRRRRITAMEALLVIYIFGGMLFHEMWEASGRYIMRYYLTMLPLAAWGLSRIVEPVGRKLAGRIAKG